MNHLHSSDALQKLPADRLIISLGILIDKYRLLTNQSTANLSIVSRVQAMADPRSMIEDVDIDD
jgi:hypothetical protein